MSTLVKISNLTKTYQRGPEKIQVLHGIDLDIDRGDFIALMGPSGSGKTTLLNLIGGLDSPSSGEIDIDGQRIDAMSAGQLSNWRSNHVGFVFQFYNLMPMLSAQKNVELPLLLTNLSAVQRSRKLLAEKIKALSTEAPASAGIIGSLPPAVMAMVMVTTPAYMMLMFTDMRGQIMLMGSALWMAAGIFTMKKMISFKF